MPIIKSAKKAARQAVKRTAQNQQIKKFIKAALKADPTPENLSKAQSEYDKAAKKGLLKKNTASRRKANLVKIAKAAKTEATEAPKKTVKKAAAKKPAAKKTVKKSAK